MVSDNVLVSVDVVRFLKTKFNSFFVLRKFVFFSGPHIKSLSQRFKLQHHDKIGNKKFESQSLSRKRKNRGKKREKDNK